MPYSPPRDTTARIRILACEPQPVVRKPSRWPVFVAAAVVGAVGVVGTLLLTPGQPPAQVLSPAIESPVAEPYGAVSVSSFRHSPAVHRSIRAIASGADLREAARVAAREQVAAREAVAVPRPALVPVTTQNNAPAGQVLPQQDAPSQPQYERPGSPSEQVASPRIKPAPSVRQQPAAPIGPESPDNVSDPSTPN